MNKEKISISVITSANLKERYSACMNTWSKDFDNVYFFGGYMNDENLISIESAGEDHNSHFLKQQLGFKYMYEANPESDWYITIGCDAIIYRERLLKMLSKYDRNEDFLIGQTCGTWTDNPHIMEIGNQTNDSNKFKALAGGAPILISNSLMKKCYGIIEEFNSTWTNISGSCYPYSDVALPYMIKKYFGVDATFEPYLLSQPPSHYIGALNGDENAKWYVDYPISLKEALSEPISFHYIKPSEMEEIYQKYKK